MPDHSDLSLRAVEDAILTLRQGRPVIIGGPSPLHVLAVETAPSEALAAEPDSVLLLSASRAEALGLQGEVAFAAEGLAPALLRALADPTWPQPASLPPAAPLPAAALAALQLAVLARLLPALLATPAPGRLGLDPADIAGHSLRAAAALERVSDARVPLEDVPDARLVAFRSPGAGLEHYAILIGQPEDAPAPLVRVHSECFTGDLLGSLRCDCGDQLRGAIRRIAAEGAGAVLYLAQEGRGIGLANKLRAYTLQDRGLDTLDANRALGFPADGREFLTAATMLRQLGLTRIRLLTNNPDKIASLAAHGIEVVARASLRFAANGVNDRYLTTKAVRFGHLGD